LGIKIEKYTKMEKKPQVNYWIVVDRS